MTADGWVKARRRTRGSSGTEEQTNNTEGCVMGGSHGKADVDTTTTTGCRSTVIGLLDNDALQQTQERSYVLASSAADSSSSFSSSVSHNSIDCSPSPPSPLPSFQNIYSSVESPPFSSGPSSSSSSRPLRPSAHQISSGRSPSRRVSRVSRVERKHLLMDREYDGRRHRHFRVKRWWQNVFRSFDNLPLPYSSPPYSSSWHTPSSACSVVVCPNCFSTQLCSSCRATAGSPPPPPPLSCRQLWSGGRAMGGRLKSWFGRFTLLNQRMEAAAEQSQEDIDIMDTTFGSDLIHLMRSANSAVRGLPHSIKRDITARKQRMLDRSERVWRRLQGAKVKQWWHKVCFLIVFYDVIVSSIWVGSMPHLYYLWHTGKYTFLMAIRFMIFRWKGWHYYLFDFCYYSNFLLLVYIWIFPKWHLLWRIIFGFNGILGLSVVVFRDSLVPHAFQRVTSAENHISPVVVMWTLRWFHHTDVFSLPDYTSQHESIYEGFIESLCAYLLWSCLYYTKLFIVSAFKIEKNNYATLYKYVAIEQGKLSRLPEALQDHGEAVFMACHFGLFFFGYLVVPILARSFYAHTLFVVSVLSTQIYNGGSFYMDYFAKHYESQLAVIEQMQEHVQMQPAVGGGGGAARRKQQQQQRCGPGDISNTPTNNSKQLGRCDDDSR
eukprot:GHVS01053469.1.p1 GENE.GHVS01053469.1~~GHVS01053469.1.p1  ORF type:complete len:661 (+),score=122.90 GHVS01053469.1:148-2130(+)